MAAASAQTSDVFNCSVPEFFQIIVDYEKYPEFLNEVSGCKVLEVAGPKKLVEFKINLIKTFTYTMWMHEDLSQGLVSWEFGGGDLFKESSGSWKIVEEAGKTRATYSISANFKTLVPGPVTKALISVNLPNMVSAYKKRVSDLYGG